ncbi:MAG: UDP-N-acetylmuramate--L-alanine ligase, partial [Candidatus Nanopelagicaceae bacterium]|nr:UDP-N-acetylmuramate--L-alanine ligase [Candidatus Nanopelagicaceae bacterium]
MISNQGYKLSELAKLKIHFIGIGGAGMSGIARIMLAKGFSISGSDKNDSSLLTSLKALGAVIFIGHDAQNLGHAELVIVSSAIAEGNPELAAAKAKSIPVVQRANALAWLMSESTSIAVAGTHGKTTTTAMLTVALQSAGLDPSFAIGGTINTAGTNAHSGSGSIFIAEADESDGSFLAYQPTGAIITNIELDHVDHFANEAAVFEVFEQFVSSIKKDGFLVACGDDPGVKTLLKRINRSDLRIFLYGKGKNNDFRISKIALAPTTSTASISNTGKKLGELQLSLPGEHNLFNSLAAFAAATAVGAAEDKLILGLKSFTGTRRRFELKGEVGGVKVIDDYGHHPTELTVTLIAAKNLAQSGRVLVVF